MHLTDFCHPNDLRAPAPRAFPARFATFAARTPHRAFGLDVVVLGDRTFSRRPNRFGGSSSNTETALTSSCLALPRPHGLRDTRARAFSSRGARAIEPLTSLSPLVLAAPVSRFRGLAVRASFRLHTRVGDSDRAAKITSTPFREKRCLSDPGCLLSVGTLRRIRWSLRPRFRDRPTTFWVTRQPVDDALTSPWAFAGALPFLSGESDSRIAVSLDAPADAFTPTLAPTLGPRSLDPDDPFWDPYAELIWDQASPYRFSATCNYDVRATKPTTLEPRRDDGQGRLPFLTHHALSRAGAVMRGELRYVRS
jgi:hypothetical protein